MEVRLSFRQYLDLGEASIDFSTVRCSFCNKVDEVFRSLTSVEHLGVVLVEHPLYNFLEGCFETVNSNRPSIKPWGTLKTIYL